MTVPGYGCNQGCRGLRSHGSLRFHHSSRGIDAEADNQQSGMKLVSLPDLTASTGFLCQTSNKSGERAPNERLEVIQWKHV